MENIANLGHIKICTASFMCKCKFCDYSPQDDKWLADECMFSVLVLLDLIAAFDTNYYCILINRLKLSVAKSATALN